jgi:C1A family cysteine protease
MSDKLIVGVLKDPKDVRDFEYIPKLSSGSQLPTKVDLRKYAGEIEDQLTTGSCVANAACSALELMTRSNKIVSNLSRLFVYWNVREPYPWLRGKDKGSYLRDAFKSVNKFGVPSEEKWPFKLSLVNKKPSPEIYSIAKNSKVLEYRRINKRNLHEVKDALAQGFPVIFSTGLGKKFLSLKGSLETQGYTKINQWTNRLVGYHAMNIVGYDDNLKGFIVENSWGLDWGDNGFCLFPYDALINDGLDVWVCTKFKINDKNIDPKDDPKDDPFTESEINILKDIIKLFDTLKKFFGK